MQLACDHSAHWASRAGYRAMQEARARTGQCSAKIVTPLASKGCFDARRRLHGLARSIRKTQQTLCQCGSGAARDGRAGRPAVGLAGRCDGRREALARGRERLPRVKRAGGARDLHAKGEGRRDSPQKAEFYAAGAARGRARASRFTSRAGPLRCSRTNRTQRR
jgi:hypothetical protein